MTISKTSLDNVGKRVADAVYSRKAQSKQSRSGAFILGLTGLQGSGKSTWAGALAGYLTDKYGLKVITISLDDLYHNHEDLVKVRQSDPSNKLLRTRGQPGTHDTQLGEHFFRQLRDSSLEWIAIPRFDKSKFNGEGDRVPREEWERVGTKPAVDVLIFEGWCVGFQPLSREVVERRWKDAADQPSKTNHGLEANYSTNTLKQHSLHHLLDVNENLERYCSAFMGPQHFDYFVHLDTNDLVNVYRWRIDQEHALRDAKGIGMIDEEVVRFVQGYMPAYELYLDLLRHTPFVAAQDWNAGRKNHLRLVLDENRNVLKAEEL
jgi:D-glycerate 3-kinase